ncbi:MAG: nucleotidyltransferase [Acidilobaceae archaeon]|nr:nucleotidyltransferase [Acidilobaceae archaeon]MCX8165409.1 nucleotidyltransferase [Acidilobaceae archaeon]MDW7973836.1 nucleotidyltransferase [Sulfolobales archaeon]
MVLRSSVGRALKALLEGGFRFTIIGGTVVEYMLGKEDLGDDVDLFAEHPSPLFEEGEYRRFAEELRWSYGQTWLGTPRMIAAVGEEVPIEFYENLYDFYVPERLLEDSVRVEIGEVKVKMVRLEHYLLLKANSGRGVDMDRLAEIAKLVRRGKLAVDARKIEEGAQSFEEGDVLLRRLREATIL